MADKNVTNELLLETLKAMQAKLSDMSTDIQDVKTDLRSMVRHLDLSEG